MILPIPLRAATELGRVPRVTLGIVLLNAAVFAWTSTHRDAGSERREAQLERLAGTAFDGQTGAPAAVHRLRESHPSALALLVDEPAWRGVVRDPQAIADLESYLADYRKVRRRDLFHRWGFVPARPTVTGVLGHMFVHADLLHLGFNMIFLWAVGCLLEDGWGHARYASFYLAGGLAAAAAHAIANRGSTEPAIGASGAVAALMGAFAVTHARTRIQIALVMMAALVPRVRFLDVPGWLFLGAWLGEQVFWALLTARMHVGIAFGAHLGGFAFGAAAGPLVRRWAARGDP